ncbi:MAG: hypothetical protein IJ026_04460 [Candidatus Methanomethylophilaceae archaeon]|nr:hypothetical protein [Candidatus Methanomethylophilaceae archaeon]
MNIRFPMKSGGRGDPPSVTLDGDTIVLDCTGCRYAPVPGSCECAGCMVRSMIEHGARERVVLRDGTDLEVSGAAGRALSEVASIARRNRPGTPATGRCRGCGAERSAVIARVWATFPGDGMRCAREMLGGACDGPGCAGCVEGTRTVLDWIEAGIRRVTEGMSGW